MAFTSAGRLSLATCLLALAALAPAFASAADGDQLTPVADGWVSAVRPERNFGRAATLRAQAESSESYLRFRLTPWLGQSAAGLQLVLSGVSGNPAQLSLAEVSPGWRERGLTYATRPAPVSDIAVTGEIVSDGVAFPLGAFFAAGTVDRDTISLRVTNADPVAAVRFRSRESSSPPRLEVAAATAEPLPVAADAYTTPVRPTTNYGAVKWLGVDADPASESLLSFDLTEWQGRQVAKVELGLYLRDVAGAGVAVYRADPAWDEANVNWQSRPASGEPVATIPGPVPAGEVTIDVSGLFPTGVVDVSRLALRLATTNADGFLLSSREGPVPAKLLITPVGGLQPSPTPPAGPDPSASPSPTPDPTPSPTPTPMFYFRGQGGDHGVGMSQYGARGRANDGQTYDQILAHYYTGTTLGTIDPAMVVRVLLATAYVPTPEAPARIRARNGGWSSAAFVDALGVRVPFPADSYVQILPTEAGWTADAYDSAGVLLASVATTDLFIEPLDATTQLEILWRSWLPRYTLYRGAVRLLVSGTTVQAINHVTMDDYIRGVVPAEMPPLWPIEALKTQAVAARSYAFNHMRPDRVYDVVPTSDHQVYGGLLLEHPRTEQAVTETANQVVMADGQVANTYFFAVAGGYTENNEFVWVGTNGNVVAAPIGYLRGLPDVDANGQAYDRNAPGFAWQSDAFSWDQLSQMLAADARTNVGNLLDIQFERGVSGRVYLVTIVGSVRTVTVSGPLFKSIYNNQKLSGGGLNSTMFYLESAPQP